MDIKVVTICGSMKFARQMQEIARHLEEKYGYCVIQCVYNNSGKQNSEQEIQNIVNAHWKKIDLADIIYVVNINGYIGSSTKKEIEYAISKGKKVVYHVDA